MKKIILLLTAALACSSCNHSAERPNSATTHAPNTHAVDANPAGISIENRTNYSEDFINSLTASEQQAPIKLIGRFMVVGSDTTAFPDDLPPGKATLFKAVQNQQNYALALTRINYTSLQYAFQLTDSTNHVLQSKTGKATINPTFYLASEGDEDSERGEGYGCYDYWDNGNGRWLSIRVGIGQDSAGKQRAKIIYGLDKGGKEELTLEECPVLRTE